MQRLRNDENTEDYFVEDGEAFTASFKSLTLCMYSL